MEDKFKVNGDGQCKSCNKVLASNKTTQCYSCTAIIHAICSNATAEEKVVTKTMINTFLLPSKQNNFLLYCDECLKK